MKHKVGEDIVYLSHFPNAREEHGLHKFITLFCGHSHSNTPRVTVNMDGGLTVNLSVELWSYAPVEFEEILAEIKMVQKVWISTMQEKWEGESNENRKNQTVGMPMLQE